MKKITAKQLDEQSSTLDKAHDRFVRNVVLKQVSQDFAKESKMGRPTIPEEKKRENNILKIYVNNEEKDEIKAFIGDRSTSDVVRNLILDAIRKAK